MAKVKAIGALQVRAYLLEHYGPEAIERIKAAMSPEDRAVYYDENLLPTQWIDVRVSVAHLNAMEVLGDSQGRFSAEVIRSLARVQINGIYRVSFKSMTIDAIVHKTSQNWLRYYDCGRTTSESVEANCVRTRLVDCPGLPRGHERLFIPYMEEVMRHAGAKSVRARHTSCIGAGADHCMTEYRWA